MKNFNYLKKLKILSLIFLDICVYIFLIFSLIFATYVIFSRNDGAVDIFGYEFRTVLTDSMDKSESTNVAEFNVKSLPKNTLVVIEKVPSENSEAQKWFASLKVGDVLTFNYSYNKNMVITHRISSIKGKKTGGYIIELSGDNKQSTTNTLTQIIDTSIKNSPNYVIGKVVNSSLVFGKVVSSLKEPVNLLLSITLPCLLVIIYEILKIVVLNYKNKLSLKDEEIARLQSEIDKLKINF